MHNATGPNIITTISGLKCDNVNCSYVDVSIKVEDYHKYINAPCPNCGSNLLTQADYDAVENILNEAHFMNEIEIPDEMIKGRVRMQGNFDGTGKVTYSIPESIDTL